MEVLVAVSPPRPPAVRLHQLEGFFHVATHQGYARAVAALPYAITEPALHQQVRKLERALGTSLLERAAGRRMHLTPAGRALYGFVAPYFEELDGVLRTLVDGEGGLLVVAAEPLYVDPLCAPAFATLRARSPGIELRLDELDAGEPWAAVRAGQADVALAIGGEVPRGIVYEPLGELGLSLVVPPTHAWAGRRGAPGPRALADQRFVVYPPHSAGRRFTELALEQAGVTLKVAAEASSAAAMESLVRAGVGPAFVPLPLSGLRRPRRRKRADGTVAFDVTELLRQFLELPRFGLYRRTGAISGLVQAFRGALEAQVKKPG
ncbi:MAG: LysR family transcriptional regulator [Planctomycetota bacterium]